MSLETLRLLRYLLDQATLNVGDPNFLEEAARVMRAVSELDAAITEAETAGPSV